MGALVALLSKKGHDSAKTAVTMIEALESKGSGYGLASPTTVNTEDSLEKLGKSGIESSTVIGYAFSRILPKDKPQPIQLKNAAMVFDGRIYPADTEKPDAEIAAEELGQHPEKGAVEFVKKTNGDFALAIAISGAIISARDTLGVRPLYYGENGGFAALASERKALWSIGLGETRSFPPGCVSIVRRWGFRFVQAKTVAYSEPRRVTMRSAARDLQILLKRSVEERISALKEVAVAFSGGLDSSVIAFLAKKTGVRVVLVHVSMRGETEGGCAEQAAEALKLPLHSSLHDENDFKKTISEVIRIIEEPDPIKVSIGIPICWAARKTAEEGCGVMLAGQGADELFGGYRRYLDDYLQGGVRRAQKAIFNDITGMHEANLERDCKICNHFNVELRLPFATYAMSRFAVNLPLKLKMERRDGTLRKLVLRKVAKNLGLPQLIVDRPKRAVQYATGVNKAFKRIAKQKGMSMAEYSQRMFQSTFTRIQCSEKGDS